MSDEQQSPPGGTPIDQPTATVQAYDQAQSPPTAAPIQEEPHKVATVVHNKNGRFDKLPELAKRLNVKSSEGDEGIWLEVKYGERYNLIELLEAAATIPAPVDLGDAQQRFHAYQSFSSSPSRAGR